MKSPLQELDMLIRERMKSFSDSDLRLYSVGALVGHLLQKLKDAADFPQLSSMILMDLSTSIEDKRVLDAANMCSTLVPAVRTLHKLYLICGLYLPAAFAAFVVHNSIYGKKDLLIFCRRPLTI